MERCASHAMASTSSKLHINSNSGTFTRRSQPAHRFNASTRIHSLDDQAEQLAKSMPKYTDVLRSADAHELSALMPDESMMANLFQDEDFTGAYDGLAPGGEELFNGPLSPNPLDSEYMLGDTNSFRNMDKNPNSGNLGPNSGLGGGGGGNNRGFMAPTTALGAGPLDALGVPRELTPEEGAIESFRIEKAISEAMATHHAIRENAYNMYGVTIRFGEILEALDFQDVAQPAPRLPGTQTKVPGWIRAEDSILEDLEQLNEMHQLMDVQHSAAELQRYRDAIAQEVDDAIKLLADTNPSAGVTYEESPDDSDIMDGLLSGLLPGTEEEVTNDFLNDILPGASNSLSMVLGLDELDDGDILSNSVGGKKGGGKVGASGAGVVIRSLDEEEDVEDDDDDDVVVVVGDDDDVDGDESGVSSGDDELLVEDDSELEILE